MRLTFPVGGWWTCVWPIVTRPNYRRELLTHVHGRADMNSLLDGWIRVPMFLCNHLFESVDGVLLQGIYDLCSRLG